MLAVLDPFLFHQQWFRPVVVQEVVRILRVCNAQIPANYWYWDPLWQEWIRPRCSDATGSTRFALDELRYRIREVALPALPGEQPITTREFGSLFDKLPGAWPQSMRKVVSGCLRTGEETMVVTLPIRGRNLEVHAHQHMTISEKTVWSLGVETDGAWVFAPVVCHLRNVDVPWTRRLESALPAEADGGRFPFCPPADWEDANVQVVRTHQSRPTIRDGQGLHWADPDTPGRANHWDVYLNQVRQEECGVSQINVTRWGNHQDKQPGSIHHVPDDKEAYFKDRSGWKCS